MQRKSESLIRAELKYLLYQFAKELEHPGAELQKILHEVISELHEDVLRAETERKRLRLVVPN